MAIFDECACPAGELDTIISNSCKTHRLPKVQRIDFQKVLTANNFVTAVNGIEEATSWDGLTAAVDDTKVSVTPFVVDVVWGENDIIEASENFEGATTKSGVRPAIVTVMIEDPTPAQVQAINNLFCLDSGASQLGVFFVMANNTILSNLVTSTPVTHGAIPISPETFIGSDPSREGTQGSRFNYTFQFALSTGWFQNSDVTAAETGFNYARDVVGT